MIKFLKKLKQNSKIFIKKNITKYKKKLNIKFHFESKLLLYFTIYYICFLKFINYNLLLKIY